MTRNVNPQKKPPSWLPTRNQRLKRPAGFLAEELDYIFGVIENDDQKAVHNHIVKKMRRICPNRNEMLIAVARAIIKSARQEDVE